MNYAQISHFGHACKNYFETIGVREGGAFAEMTAAQLTDEYSWEIMKQYFPNATEMFEKMVMEALHGPTVE